MDLLRTFIRHAVIMPFDSGAGTVTSDNIEDGGGRTFPVFLDNGRNTPTSHPVLWRDAYGNLVQAQRQIVHITTDATAPSYHSSLRNYGTSPVSQSLAGSAAEKNGASEKTSRSAGGRNKQA